MRALITSSILLLASAAQATTFPFPMQSETLPSGLRVVTVPMDSPGLFAYFTLVRVGSRNEVEPGHTGFAHFFEHMMFRGTERFPAERQAQLTRDLGLHSNAFTWDDETVYFYAGPKTALPQVIEMEADRFQHLKYAKEAFQTEAKAVLGEYNKDFADPAMKMEEALLDRAFVRHTYKHTTIGVLADVLKMPEQYDYSLQFFRRFYRPDNCTLFVIGDFDRAAVLKTIRAEYGAWRGHAEPAAVPIEPPQTQERSATVDWPSQAKPRVLVGWHTPEAGTQAAAVQKVLGPYLFGEASPLYRELVLERQLVESFEVAYLDDDRPGHRDPRLFYYQATAKRPNDLPAVMAAVDRAIAALANGQVNAQLLSDVKRHLRYGLLTSLETPTRVGEFLSLVVAPTGDLGALDRLFDQMAGVTPAALSSFAQQYLVPTHRTTVTLMVKEKK